MDIFNLPDLGEGLPDAEIHEWFVKEGDTVALDQPLVSMETAKAVVEVPSPQQGVIAKRYGQVGDLIKTGEPLIAFNASEQSRTDQGTIVGNLEESKEVAVDHFTIGSADSPTKRPKATPNVRLFAKKCGIDLSTVKGSGEHGMIRREDVQAAVDRQTVLPEGFEAIQGVRRAMLASMLQAHQQVVAVSIFDEANIHAWQPETDITIRLIRALLTACKQEPALNAWFDSKHNARKQFEEVHLGLAMDSSEGLFVPVIHHATNYSDQELREIINDFKRAVNQREIPAEKLKGATISLSNFGKFAGRYASPVIIPPSVAILGVGRLYEGVVAYQGKAEIHPLLPLSLSFDHRVVTGGEATRFLGAVITALQESLG